MTTVQSHSSTAAELAKGRKRRNMFNVYKNEKETTWKGQKRLKCVLVGEVWRKVTKYSISADRI